MTSTKLKTSAPNAWRFLRFVPFATLDAWGYAALFSEKKRAPLFPTVPLSELITHRKGFIRIDDSQRYSRCRVQLRAQGVVLRDEVLGSAIKTKQQQVCRAGDFLVAEIDAKLGGFGIVPPDLEGAVVSSHYFLFDINASRLNREYLALCLRTDFFQRQVQSTGSTNYAAIRPTHVLGYNIPLPPLAEQKRLVAAHHDALTKAGKAETRASEREQEAARFLETALGLQTEATKPKRTPAKLHFVRFATLERWGDVFLDSTSADTQAKYPMVRLGDVIADLQNGWSPKCLARPATTDEWAVLKLGAVSFGEFDETANKALPTHFKPKPEFEVKPGDVLITRGNALSLVGAAVHVTTTRERLMMPDLVFRAVWSPSSAIDGAFLAEALRMPFMRSQIESVATGTSPSMKKVTKPALFNLRFPLPPLSEQRRIVERLDALRAEARTAHADAELGRETARRSFEIALFG